MAPTNTPVRLPRSDAGSMPARSSASHEVSSSSRCCGSIASASRGQMPKNAGVETGRRRAGTRPRVAYVVPGRSGSGSNSAVEVPAPVGRELRRPRRRPPSTSVPQILRRAHAAGEAAAHADDGDRLRSAQRRARPRADAPAGARRRRAEGGRCSLFSSLIRCVPRLDVTRPARSVIRRRSRGVLDRGGREVDIVLRLCRIRRRSRSADDRRRRSTTCHLQGLIGARPRRRAPANRSSSAPSDSAPNSWPISSER